MSPEAILNEIKYGKQSHTEQCALCGELYDATKPHKCKTNDAGENTSVTIDATLAERGNRYGAFSRHAEISQSLQRIIAQYGGYQKFTDGQSEAMNMILHKVARIVNGDPNYDDSWRDIAGYAQLIVDNLNGKDT